MEGNRITAIRVKGLRTLADVTLKLDGLTVLIGHNGSGKSSLIEVCEILRRAAGENFAEELQQIHGGPSALARFGCHAIEFIVQMYLNGIPAEYSFAVGTDDRIRDETFGYTTPPIPGFPSPVVPLIERHEKRFRYAQHDGSEMLGNEDSVDSRRLVLSSFGSFPPHWMIREAIKLLRGIDVQLPFDTTARWAQRARGAPMPIRGTSVIEPADSWRSGKRRDTRRHYSLRGQTHQNNSTWFSSKKIPKRSWKRRNSAIRVFRTRPFVKRYAKILTKGTSFFIA